MISPDEAWRRIGAHVAPLGEEGVERRAALGRVLAREVAATLDVPADDVSAMDGYALAGEVAAGERRGVAATVVAGDAPGLEMPAGAAVRIMTGAPVPRGADRVIPVEMTEGPAKDVRVSEEARRAEGGDRSEVVFREGVAAGANIRRRGEVMRAGDALLPAGTALTPGALALLATHGYAEVPVHRAPSVAVLATGDEVVAPDSVPGPGRLRDSHTDFLLAAGASLGLRVTPLGIAPDRVDELTALVERGLRHDVLLLCGGVSMGELDLVEGVLAALGCQSHFTAVAIQPGKPMVFATHPGGLVFGLPGNPASVMVGFWLFVRPALRCLLGGDDAWWRGAVAATLGAPLPGAGARDRFLPAMVTFTSGGAPRVDPLAPRGSHDLAAYARGSALVRVPAGSPPSPAGAECQILPLADWRE